MDLIFYVVMTLLMVEMLLNLRYRLIKLLPQIGNSNSFVTCKILCQDIRIRQRKEYKDMMRLSKKKTPCTPSVHSLLPVRIIFSCLLNLLFNFFCNSQLKCIKYNSPKAGYNVAAVRLHTHYENIYSNNGNNLQPQAEPGIIA